VKFIKLVLFSLLATQFMTFFPVKFQTMDGGVFELNRTEFRKLNPKLIGPGEVDEKNDSDQVISLPLVDGDTFRTIKEILQFVSEDGQSVYERVLHNYLAQKSGQELGNLVYAFDFLNCDKLLRSVIGSYVTYLASEDFLEEFNGTNDLKVYDVLQQPLSDRLWPYLITCLHTVQEDTSDAGIVWSPDRSKLVIRSFGLTNGFVCKLLDIRTGKFLHTWDCHEPDMSIISWSPDGSKLAIGSYDSLEEYVLNIFDIQTGECRQILRWKAIFVNSIAWSSGSDKLATETGDNELLIWDVQKGKFLYSLQGHNFCIDYFMWSPDGKKLATGSDDSTAKIWNMDTGECLYTLIGHTNTVHIIAWSSDGSKLATGSVDKTVKIWNIQTGQCLYSLQGTGLIDSVIWSKDGERLATGSSDVITGVYTIKIWDVQTGECLHVVPIYIGEIFSVAYSPDMSKVAVGSADKTVMIWNVETGECFHVLSGHKEPIWSIAWSPDGNKLVTGSADKTAKVWNVETGKCLYNLQGTGLVNLVDWSSDGDKLTIGSNDQDRSDSYVLKIWNVREIRLHPMQQLFVLKVMKATNQIKLKKEEPLYHWYQSLPNEVKKIVDSRNLENNGIVVGPVISVVE